MVHWQEASNDTVVPCERPEGGHRFVTVRLRYASDLARLWYPAQPNCRGRGFGFVGKSLVTHHVVELQRNQLSRL